MASFGNVNEREVIELEIVRAIEENTTHILSKSDVTRANFNSKNQVDDISYIKMRSKRLFSKLPATIQAWKHFALILEDWYKFVFLSSLFVGILSNYIGSAGEIHIVYNPLTFLLFWNLIVCLFFIISELVKIKIPFRVIKKIKFSPKNISTYHFTNNKKRTPIVFRLFFGNFYKWISSFRIRADENKSATLNALNALLNSYFINSAKGLSLRFRGFLSLSAIGLLLGAVIGVYFRGLFQEYRFIWESTFLVNIENITFFLNVIFGPASLILEGDWVSIEMTNQLLMQGGILAGPWINKIVITSFIFVLIPRTLLVFFFFVKSGRINVELELSDPYYEEILISKNNLKDDIRVELRSKFVIKIEEFSNQISHYVVDKYFDGEVMPIILNFKDNGGRVSFLKNELEKSEESFKKQFLDFFESAKAEFTKTLNKEIFEFLGKKNIISLYSIENDINISNSSFPNSATSNIKSSIENTIIVAVSSFFTTIGGGIASFINSIIGVSGPIGMLKGGVIGILVARSYKLLKSDKNSANKIIEDIHIPALLASLAIKEKKIIKARKELINSVFEQTREILMKNIEQSIDKIIEGLEDELDLD